MLILTTKGSFGSEIKTDIVYIQLQIPALTDHGLSVSSFPSNQPVKFSGIVTELPGPAFSVAFPVSNPRECTIDSVRIAFSESGKLDFSPLVRLIVTPNARSFGLCIRS